jgi:hypothetical protein
MHLIEIRRLYPWMAMPANRRKSLIVRNNDDHVWPGTGERIGMGLIPDQQSSDSNQEDKQTAANDVREYFHAGLRSKRFPSFNC